MFDTFRRRAAPMRARCAVLALLLITVMLAACGGGGGGDDPPATATPQGLPAQEVPGGQADPTAPGAPPKAGQATAVGEAQGSATSASIGPAGGQLRSADGGLTLVVPAGAFAQPTTVAIQPISNAAHGGKGVAYRITPEGLHTAVPMTLRFQIDDAMLQGGALGAMTVATQHADGRWHAWRRPARDAVARTLAVQTTHFSDWATVAWAQLQPAQAEVAIGQTIDLSLVKCEAQAADADTAVVGPCAEQLVLAGELDQWAVNGVPGGHAAIGTVAEIPLTGNPQGEAPGRARYSAPVDLPRPNPVAVSVQYLEVLAGAVPVTLVSNIRVVPFDRCTWMRQAATLNFEVEIDYHYTGSGPLGLLSLNQAGTIRGTLRSVDQNDLFGVWQGLTTVGSASLNDQRTTGDRTWRIFGDGPPANGTGMDDNQLSGATVVVDYRTCTYSITAKISVLATSGEPNDPPRVREIGSFTRGNLTIDARDGLGGAEAMPPRLVPDARGTYAPGGFGTGLIADGYDTGPNPKTAMVRWLLHRMQ